MFDKERLTVAFTCASHCPSI